MSHIKSYLKYIKEQDDNVKSIHAVVVATFLTFIFATVYLYLVRGIAPPVSKDILSKERVYNSNNLESESMVNESSVYDTKNFEGKVISEKGLEKSETSPYDALYDMFKNIKNVLVDSYDDINKIEYKVNK